MVSNIDDRHLLMTTGIFDILPFRTINLGSYVLALHTFVCACEFFGIGIWGSGIPRIHKKSEGFAVHQCRSPFVDRVGNGS